MVLVQPLSPDLKTALNHCYLEFDPQWFREPGLRLDEFKHYLEREAGVRIEAQRTVDLHNRVCYKVDSLEVLDAKKFTFWCLKWA